jgi:dTDP-glucose 4,6-dehydratase
MAPNRSPAILSDGDDVADRSLKNANGLIPTTMDQDPLRPLPASDLDQISVATESIWRAQDRAHFFITGATGFFGQWLLESLVAANRRFGLRVEATVLSRDPASFLARRPHLAEARELHWVRGSAVDFTVAQVAAARTAPADPPRFAAVIHLVTEADNDRTVADPLAAYDVIAGSTRRALEFATAVGARRFLFTSSGSVYGLQPPALPRVAEDYAGAPDGTDGLSAYAVSGSAKRAAETLCVAYGKSRGLEAVIARCFAFSGPGLPVDSKFALGNFLSDALAGREIVVKGDGTPVRSYLYASDLAVWLWTLLVRGSAGRAYNVGSEHPITIQETAEAVRREVAPGARVRVSTPPDPARPTHRYVPSTARIRTELGVRETVPLAEGIRRMAAWLRRTG